MDFIFNTIGTIGTLIVCFSSVPQIVKTFRTRSAGDLSILYLSVLNTGLVLMLIYSFYVGNLVFILGNVLSVGFTVIMMVLWLRYGD